MAETVTNNLLRSLAAFRASNGCAISIYIDLPPSSIPTAAAAETAFHSALDQAQKEAEERADSRDCRMALRDDLERLREWWDAEFDRDGTLALALFASSADGFFRALPLAASVPEVVRINGRLAIGPLVSQLGNDGALVAVVSRERGTVYRLESGRLVELVDETEEVPGRHDQGGWSQARYQRHIENIVREHLKAVGEELTKRVHDRKVTMVVVAPDELRGEFEQALPKEVKEAIIGSTTADAHASPNELLEVVRPLLDEAHARDAEHALERFEEAHGRGDPSAAGWHETLEAASDARVDTLLLEEGATKKAWECPQCGRASADGGPCPLDGTTLEEREDGAELAIHATIANGGEVVRLGSGALGAEADGIAALLRF